MSHNTMTNRSHSRIKLIATGIVAAIVIAVAGTWGYLQWRHHKLMSMLVRVCYDTTGMRSGDLVFRNGLGNESLLVTGTSGGQYSHVGIVYRTDAGTMVIHAVPGENVPGEPEYIKCEPMDSFFDPHRACTGGWVVIDCPDSVATAAASVALSKYKARVTFDNDYELADTTTLYCTELVRLCYLKQGIDLSEDRFMRTSGINREGTIVFPEHLLQSQRVSSHVEFPTRHTDIPLIKSKTSLINK